MEDIILIGSGQHAGVVLYNITEQGRYRVVGILEADPHKHGKVLFNIPVLGDYSESTLKYVAEKYGTKNFFIGFGAMKYRKKVFNQMVSYGWEAVNIIHPDAVVSPTAVLGKGILIEAGCLVTPSPVIGDNVVINTGSQVNHDNIIESHVYIASGVILSGGITVKENTLLDDGVIISLGKTVGQNCVIGAGSIVTKDIGNGVIAYGNPCRAIKENDNI